MDAIAQRWSDLADRRRRYFIELYDSGRWKHYYSEEEFRERLRDVVKASETWTRLAEPRPQVYFADETRKAS